MAIRVGRWDCNVCGTKGILGPETQCPNCASPRPENVAFYLADDSEIVEDEKKLSEAQAGADWICSYCSGHNKAWQDHCQSCGNAKSVANGDEHIKESVEYIGKWKKEEASDGTSNARAATSAPPRGGGVGKKLLKVLGFGVAIVVILSILASFDKEIQVQVLHHGWERTVKMEQNVEVTEEDWNLPSGARLIDSRNEIHHYNQVLIGHEQRTRTVQVQTGTRRVKCGTRNKGNGYFEDVYCDEPVYQNKQESYQEPIYRKDPIYQTKYRYKIMRWKNRDPLVARGKTKNAEWPKPSAAQQGSNFRQGKKAERYWLNIKLPNGEEKIEDVSKAKWNAVPEKGTLPATKSLIFGFYKGLKEG